MVHGDDSGLVLPPKIAPTQVMIIPIQQKKEGVLEKAYELRDRLSGFRVKVDDTDKSPGWKFSEQEMRGIPMRIEIGPKDIEAGKCVICRRDNGEKIEVALDQIEEKVAELLVTIQADMLEKAKKHLEAHTYTATTREEYITKAINKAKYKYPKGKVKPGYKKKIKTAIAIAKNKHKKKIIRTNLAKKDLTHGV